MSKHYSQWTTQTFPDKNKAVRGGVVGVCTVCARAWWMVLIMRCMVQCAYTGAEVPTWEHSHISQDTASSVQPSVQRGRSSSMIHFIHILMLWTEVLNFDINILVNEPQRKLQFLHSSVCRKLLLWLSECICIKDSYETCSCNSLQQQGYQYCILNGSFFKSIGVKNVEL